MSSAHTHKYYWKPLPAKLGVPDLDISVSIPLAAPLLPPVFPKHPS